MLNAGILSRNFLGRGAFRGPASHCDTRTQNAVAAAFGSILSSLFVITHIYIYIFVINTS